MREYQPIWVKLKSLPKKEAEEVGVTVIVNRRLHPRIVKAVTKEKWMDLGYKLTNEPRIAVLSHSSSFSRLTFFLTQSLCHEDL